MKIITPYDDEKMIYNKDTNRYVLNTAFVREEFGNPYNNDGILEKRIKKNSRVVYGYIYKVGNSRNREIVDFILNRTQEGRKFIFDILSSQIDADLETGINSIGDIPRINIKSGQALDKEAMVDGYISEYTKSILDESIGRVGINIIYQGVFPPQIWMQYRSLLK